jgi:5'-methylthioadenosine phosphorylase
VPYRANIYALKALGATHLVSFSAVGSLREDLPPRTVVLPDQIIDRTVSRARTFFEDGLVVHVGLADPFCPRLTDSVSAAAIELATDVRRGGTYVCIEGPQFSTRAESRLYRSWNATIIGMTAMPEARLAREAELCYAVVALVTDYDVWHESEADVSVETVMFNLRANADFAVNLVDQLCRQGLPERSCLCDESLDDAVVTAPRLVEASHRERYSLFLGDRWPLA